MKVLSNALKYGFLFTAAFILLLHSFVPHQHHTLASSEPTISACVHNENNLLGFLAQVFHLDLGNEHLEDFKPVQKVDFNISSTLSASVLVFEHLKINLILENSYYVPDFVFLWDQFFRYELQQRGPPQLKSIVPQSV